MELCDLNLRNFLQKKWPLSLEASSGVFLRGELEWPTMRTALSIIDDITNGVAFIHSLSLVHRDLKPENGKSMNEYICLSKSSIQMNLPNGKSLTSG